IDEATGEWSFVLNNSLPATQALKDGDTINVSFEYTLTDSDGDDKSGTVRFEIRGTTDTAGVEPVGGAGDDAGTGYERDLDSEDGATTDGQFSVEASDGIDTVTIGGETFAIDELEGATITTSRGEIEITGVALNGDSTEATVSYTYTLGEAQTH